MTPPGGVWGRRRQITLEQNVLQALSVTKYYPGAKKPAVDNLDLTVLSGEFVSILGKSGSGKSTLLHILSSLALPDSGQVLFEGKNIAAAPEKQRNALRRNSFAMIFQQHHLVPYLSSLENVLLPLLDSPIPVSAKQTEAARAMLAKVGLFGKESILPGKLSGGEQQRVAIARALMRGARVLFADEPTGSLDSATGLSIMELLHTLNQEGTAIIMVTHNPDYARDASRSITMADGHIVA